LTSTLSLPNRVYTIANARFSKAILNDSFVSYCEKSPFSTDSRLILGALELHLKSQSREIEADIAF
jgi:hypothetical protein